MPVEVRYIDSSKGRGLFALTNITKHSVIFKEEPLVACQYSWNAFYKYDACNHCLRPLETAQENARRLTGNNALILPYPEKCLTIQEAKVKCPKCEVEYCSEPCRELALQQYHKVLCHKKIENQVHPLDQLEETWKQIHYPPETASILLLARLLARIIQAEDKDQMIAKIYSFCHTSINRSNDLVHKILGEEFKNHIDLIRDLMKTALPNKDIEVFLTPDGFQSLLALMATNGQGIGSSAISAWRNNVDKLSLPETEQREFNHFVNRLYSEIHSNAGEFENNEGSGLYVIQSCINHSCIPNAEISFSHNFELSVVALRDIKDNEEITISYLDDCMIKRSRHSRRKILMEHYLFACNCPKCEDQIDDRDVTSDDEPTTSEVGSDTE